MNDQPIPPQGTEDTSDPSQVTQLLNGLFYGLSLPERMVRSAVGMTAGTAKEIASLVVPQAFQDSKSYELAVRNSLNFLLSSVGTITPATKTGSEQRKDAGGSDSCGNDVMTGSVTEESSNGGQPSDTVRSAADSFQAVDPDDPSGGNPGRFIARKAVGNFIDITGLATLHISPLWILAIVSDAAYGTRSYLNELSAELRKQGVIDETSTIHRVDDLMQAIRDASGKAASNFDTPPLSLSELKMSLDQTREAIQGVDPRLLIPEAEISRLWGDMKKLAAQENISLLGVSGAVAMQAAESIRNVSRGSLTGLFLAGRIVNRNVFGHYRNAVSQIYQEGLWSSVNNSCGPYIDLAWSNFTRSRKTWTEQILSTERISGLLNSVKGMFRSK